MSLVSPVKAIPRRLREAVTPHNTPTEGSLVECDLLPFAALKQQLNYTTTETNEGRQTWSVSRPLPPSNDPAYADLFERCHSWVEHLNPGMIYTLTGPADQPPTEMTLRRFAQGNCTACGTHLEYEQGDKYICLESPTRTPVRSATGSASCAMNRTKPT